MTFWGLVLFGLLVLAVGTIFLSYWIPKKLGNRRLGIVLSCVLIAGLILWTTLTIFKDDRFFKPDAREFLSNHDIVLKDDFKITYHDTDEILDAYQRFNLEISHADKLKIIETIKSADNFRAETLADQQDNSITSINYEDEHAFVRKSTQTFGPGEISIIVIIEVNKKGNSLTCYKYIP